MSRKQTMIFNTSKMKQLSVYFILTIICFLNSNQLNAQTPEVDHWETAIFAEDDWKYFIGTSEPDIAWNEIGFNDSAWLQGKGGIGFGDGDDSTIIAQTTSIYLRKTFNLSDASEIVHAIINADYDDSFVAYLNGHEISRDNIGEYGTAPTFDELATTHKEAVMYTGEDPSSFFLHSLLIKDIIQNGTNVFAIQVHNSSPTSSDLSAIFYLNFGISTTTDLFSTTSPTWFKPPTVSFSTSSLPIIEINTNNQAIDPDVRIVGDMGIIYNGQGQPNSFGGTYNEYDGKISLEYRGQSSLEFDKKSISFETQDIVGENLNVELLGLPKENDWVLYAPYSDKSLIRNALTYKLQEEMGHYAPRFRFCELMINNEYQGIYLLTEKIKRDKNRVDIAKLSNGDLAGDDVTGGYILKIDKDADPGMNSWEATNIPDYNGWSPTEYQYHYPKVDDIIPEQKQYIQDYMNDFDLALKATSYTDSINGYRPYVDVNSFLDYLIITELSKDVDSYRYSVFFYKQKETKGGKIVFGPVWDMNTGYGNSDYSTKNADETFDWSFDKAGKRIFWFDRMMSDSTFKNELNCRWHNLRSTTLATNKVFGLIDSLTSLLEIPKQRNFYKWQILGNYVWPNKFVGQTYEEEIDYLKDWLTDRMEWMDDSIPGNCIPGSNGIRDFQIVDLQVFPNPSDGDFRIRFNNPIQGNINVSIVDLAGKVVHTIQKQNQPIGYDITNVEPTELATGIYQILISSNQTLIGSKKLIIK